MSFFFLFLLVLFSYRKQSEKQNSLSFFFPRIFFVRNIYIYFLFFIKNLYNQQYFQSCSLQSLLVFFLFVLFSVSCFTLFFYFFYFLSFSVSCSFVLGATFVVAFVIKKKIPLITTTYY